MRFGVMFYIYLYTLYIDIDVWILLFRSLVRSFIWSFRLFVHSFLFLPILIFYANSNRLKWGTMFAIRVDDFPTENVLVYHKFRWPFCSVQWVFSLSHSIPFRSHCDVSIWYSILYTLYSMWYTQMHTSIYVSRDTKTNFSMRMQCKIAENIIGNCSRTERLGAEIK